MGKDANSSRRCRRTRGPDASRSGQGPTVPMQEGQRATGQAAAAMAGPDAKKKCDGRFAILNQFWARGPLDGNLKPSEVATWVCMWTAERKGFVSISYGQIARETNLGHASVERAISSLLEKAMLKVVRQGDVHGHVNRYVLSPYPNEGTLSERAKAYAQNEGRHTLKCAETYAQNEVYPDGKEEGLPSSSFQTGRSGPTDARLGDARSVLPTPEQTDSDGGTIPLCPPSISTHESGRPDYAKDAEFRKQANKLIDRRLALGEPLETIRSVSRLTIAKGDVRKQRIFDEELAKRCAG